MGDSSDEQKANEPTPQVEQKHVNIKVPMLAVGGPLFREREVSSDDYATQLRMAAPGVPVGVLVTSDLDGLPGFRLEAVGFQGAPETIGDQQGWLTFIGEFDGGRLDFVLLRARIYPPNLPAFAEAICPGPTVTLRGLERLERISDAREVLKGANLLRKWPRGRPFGSGVVDESTFYQQLDMALARLLRNRIRVTQALVARELDMDRSTFLKYLRRYGLPWPTAKARVRR